MDKAVKARKSTIYGAGDLSFEATPWAAALDEQRRGQIINLVSDIALGSAAAVARGRSAA